MSAILVFNATNTHALDMDTAYGQIMDGPLPERVLVLSGDDVLSLSPAGFIDLYWEGI